MTDKRNIVPLPTRKDAEQAAAEWLMRLEDGEMSREEYLVFQNWKMRSDLNREAFDALSSLWGELDIISDFEHYMPSEKEIAHRGQGRGVWMAVAAAFLVFVSVGIVFLGRTQGGAGPDLHYEARYETAIGEQKTVVLADGSTVELNTGTQVEIVLEESAREVWLLQGEAYFSVAPDRQRPFSVHAGENTVTALGTAFTVRLQDERIEVTVSEGRVQLAPRLSPEAALEIVPESLLEVVAGQNVVVEDAVHKLDLVDPAMLDRKLSWRSGMLAFSGEALGEVVGDVSRYTDIVIEIEDPEVAAMPVAGYFKVGDVGALLDALEIMAGIHAEEVDAGRIRLTRSEDE